MTHGHCPIVHLLELVGQKWVGLIIKSMMEGKHTFCGIKDSIGCNAKILVERLDTLIDEGIIEKQLESLRPVKIKYVLTPLGEELGEKILDLCQRAKKVADTKGVTSSCSL